MDPQVDMNPWEGHLVYTMLLTVYELYEQVKSGT